MGATWPCSVNSTHDSSNLGQIIRNPKYGEKDESFRFAGQWEIMNTLHFSVGLLHVISFKDIKLK